MPGEIEMTAQNASVGAEAGQPFDEYNDSIINESDLDCKEDF